MAKLKVVGMDVAFSKMGDLANEAEGISKVVLYEGAKVTADAVRRNIQSLPERDPKEYARNKKVKGVTPEEKAALLDGLGIAHMRNGTGAVDTVLGFDGYFGKPTKSYPKGKPIPLIARSVERGTSWLTRTAFIKPAVGSSQGQAEAAMANKFDEEIKKRG